MGWGRGGGGGGGAWRCREEKQNRREGKESGKALPPLDLPPANRSPCRLKDSKGVETEEEMECDTSAIKDLLYKIQQAMRALDKA